MLWRRCDEIDRKIYIEKSHILELEDERGEDKLGDEARQEPVGPHRVGCTLEEGTDGSDGFENENATTQEMEQQSDKTRACKGEGETID